MRYNSGSDLGFVTINGPPPKKKPPRQGFWLKPGRDMLGMLKPLIEEVAATFHQDPKL